MGSVRKMISANWLRETTRSMALLFAALVLALGAQAVMAAPADEAAPAAEAVDASADAAASEASGYTPLGPEMIKGQPTSYEDDALASMTFQDQYNDIGREALWMHDVVLMPVITIISLFVLFLLLYVMARYRKGANPQPSKTTHNTLIEVVWTVIPILILLVIAVPSIRLLANQYETPPEDAITIKATGYQWYWGYSYPDQGGFEVISNMLPEDEAKAKGLPGQLAVDNRMVVPVGVPLRIQTTAADVIHSFALPSLWFKNDAVPGRINEKLLTIDEPGIYYGQCSELCGARHGFMPIAVEAVPMEQFRAWVASKGGSMGDEAAAEDAESAADAAETGDEAGAEAAEPAEAAAE
ncbi:cytochrome c oxidase subunit II [Parerythrobacter aestuarii]|uniref:cytochrome c oxidase subunit II n=1 Tax=Parerythrobacter aestuarii TaxID=3020909 RepID=UPI0024DE1582|nr:cytochrome c oxidase subunit II [Parerythrobacter aestuarii]